MMNGMKPPKLGASNDVTNAVAKAMSKAAVVFSDGVAGSEDKPPEWVSKLAREAASGLPRTKETASKKR